MISRVLLRGRQESQSKRKRHDGGTMERFLRCCAAGFKDKGRSHKSRNVADL